MHAKVTVFGLKADAAYVLYRYTGFNSFPQSDLEHGYERKVPFVAAADTWTHRDPQGSWCKFCSCLFCSKIINFTAKEFRPL